MKRLLPSETKGAAEDNVSATLVLVPSPGEVSAPCTCSGLSSKG